MHPDLDHARRLLCRLQDAIRDSVRAAQRRGARGLTRVAAVTTADTIYGIDTEGLALYEFPGQAFVPFHPGNGMRPINQDAVAQGIVWSGQLVLENPLFSYRIITA